MGNRSFVSRNSFTKRKFGFLENSTCPKALFSLLLLKVFSSHYSLNNNTTCLSMSSRVHLMTVPKFSDLVIKSLYYDIMMFLLEHTQNP